MTSGGNRYPAKADLETGQRQGCWTDLIAPVSVTEARTTNATVPPDGGLALAPMATGRPGDAGRDDRRGRGLHRDAPRDRVARPGRHLDQLPKSAGPAILRRHLRRDAPRPRRRVRGAVRGAAAALVVRRRSGDAELRQQIKWVAFIAALFFVCQIAVTVALVALGDD